MNNNYLIPANSKKSMLILGFFTPVDLGIFVTGVGISLLLLMLIKSNNLWLTLLLATPAIFSAFLVAPIPNYHNVRTLLGNIYRFYTNRRNYRWRGWCIRNETRTK